MKFIEFGIGNRWLVRTETELQDGTEFEQKGIVKPINAQSFYIRAWIGKTVWIADTKEGFKKVKKNVENLNYYSALKVYNKRTQKHPRKLALY